MPKVSVIVPNYNHAPYLRQRLDSIFNQTFQNFEVIILDDCSTDISKEIIEEYRSKSQVSHIVYNETNSGSPFKQWAKGFELAQGEYIWIAESDDWAESNFLEVLVSFLERNDNISLTFSASTWVYPNHKENVLLYPCDTEINGNDFIKSRMICGNSIHNASSVVFRKKCLKSVSNSYTNFKGSGDYQFWVNLCETGNVFYVASLLNNFRKHPENTTQKCRINGLTFKEDYLVFSHMKQKGFIPSFTRKNIVSFYLAKIKRFPNSEATKDALKIWRKEIKNEFFYQSICFFIGLCIRFLPTLTKKWVEKKVSWSYFYKNYSALELIWNALHLPNSNFKKFISKK